MRRAGVGQTERRDVLDAESVSKEGQFEWTAIQAEVAEACALLGVPEGGRGEELPGAAFNRVFPFTDAEGARRVVRLRPRWLTERRIEFEHALARHLSEQDVPVLAPVPVADGRTWVRAGGCYAEVYAFVSGRLGHPQADDARLLGEVLGCFHSAALTADRRGYEPPQAANQLDLAELTRLFAEIDAAEHREEPLASLLPLAAPVLDSARARLEHLRRPEAPLPSTIRHGDPHVWNVLYADAEPTRVLALLDLDMAAEGPRSFDLSYAMYFLIQGTAPGPDPLKPDGPSRSLCQELVRGYGTDLAPAEAAAAPVQMHSLALHFLYWDLLRMTSRDELALAVRRYQSMAEWLEEHAGEVMEVVLGR